MPTFTIKNRPRFSDGIIWEVVEAVRNHSIAPALLQWTADRNNEVAASVSAAAQMSMAQARKSLTGS